MKQAISYISRNSSLRFGITFIALFLVLYYGNILFFGITSPGNNYVPYLDKHLNYISGLREVLMSITSAMLNLVGFDAIHNDKDLLVAGHGMVRMIYTCLGLGVMSFFTAFVIAYPKRTGAKITFLICGLLSIQILNICRIGLLALYWDRRKARIIDHHLIFDVLIYIIIGVALYFWVNHKASNVKTAN